MACTITYGMDFRQAEELGNNEELMLLILFRSFDWRDLGLLHRSIPYC